MANDSYRDAVTRPDDREIDGELTYLNRWQQHTLELPSEQQWIKFVAQESGYYRFEFESDKQALDCAIYNNRILIANESGSRGAQDVFLAAGSVYYLQFSTSAAGSVDYLVKVNVKPDAWDPDDDYRADAVRIQAGRNYEHTLGIGDNNDWMTFTVAESGNYLLQTEGGNVVVILYEDDKQIAFTMGPNASLTFDAVQGAAYYLQISSGASYTASYRLQLADNPAVKSWENLHQYNFYGGGTAAGTSVHLAVNNDSTEKRVNYFYGGGFGIGADVNGYVDVTIAGGSYWKFYGGGADSDVTGSIRLQLQSGEITNVLYGGGMGNVGGSIDLTIEAAVTFVSSHLYGGTLNGYTKDLNSAKGGDPVVNGSGSVYRVAGDITMNLNGISLSGLVHGGNYNLATDPAAGHSEIGGRVTLNLNGVTHHGPNNTNAWLFGGSYANQAGASDLIRGGVVLNIAKSKLDYVLAGGRSGYGGKTEIQSVDITVSGSRIARNLYGGGFSNNGQADVLGNVHITIDSSASSNSLLGSIFLAGYAVGAGNTANVYGDATLTLINSTIFNGYIYGGGHEISGGQAQVSGATTLEMANYRGTFNGVIIDFDRLVLRGNSRVEFGKEQAGNGFSAYCFDLSDRQISQSTWAMLTQTNGIDFSLAAADTQRSITISSAALDGRSAGSYFLVDSEYSLLKKLTGQTFELNFEDALASLKVDGDAVELGGYQWELKLADGDLTLYWRNFAAAPLETAANLAPSEADLIGWSESRNHQGFLA